MINTDNIDFTSFYNSARELCEMYKQELENQRVNASGELSRSVDFDVDFDNDSITLYFNMAIWWYYVEKGRKPTGSGGGQSWAKSIEELEQWIRNKTARGWFVPRANQTIPRTDKEIKSVAYAIRHKIHKVGWYGNSGQHYGLHILENVLNEAEANGLIDKMVQSVVNGYDKEINVELQKI